MSGKKPELSVTEQSVRASQSSQPSASYPHEHCSCPCDNKPCILCCDAMVICLANTDNTQVL